MRVFTVTRTFELTPCEDKSHSYRSGEKLTAKYHHTSHMSNGHFNISFHAPLSLSGELYKLLTHCVITVIILSLHYVSLYYANTIHVTEKNGL
jgi:hypothetical protein